MSFRRSHKRVLNRVASWWDHVNEHSVSEFPMLVGINYILKQEAHISYCIHQASDMVTQVESRLQPVLAMRIPKVYIPHAMTVTLLSHFWLRRLLHLCYPS